MLKGNQAKNKMAAPDALEGLYVFYRSNRNGFTDSGVGLVRSQIVGGAGAAVVAIQDYDVKLKVPTPTPAYALTAPHRARVYLTAPTAADAWDMIENHEKALVAVRDLSHGHVNDRVCLDGGEYWLKGFSVHGVASLVTFSDPAPFQLPDPILKPPRALKFLTLWVAPVPVAAGHGTTKTQVDVTVRGDSYIDPDGSVKNRGTYLGGKAVPKDDRWLKFASDEAGTTNLTSPLGLQNILVLFDFAYYPALYESASSAQACSDAIAARFEAVFSADLAKEHSQDAHPVLQSTLTHLKSLYHLMGVAVRHDGPVEEIRNVVAALRAILGPRLRAKEWRLSLISEPNCISPPWYFREEKHRLTRLNRKKKTAVTDPPSAEKKREHEEDDEYGY